MAKINLSNVLTLLGINSNFQKVEDELNNKVLYRNNPVGEPNTMETSLDMNGERIFNLPLPLDLNEPARLADIANNASATALKNDLANTSDPAKGAALVGYTPADGVPGPINVNTRLSYLDGVSPPVTTSDAYSAGGVQTLRNASLLSGGTPGFVNTSIMNRTITGVNETAFEWGMLSIMDNFATAGENVAIYGQGNRLSTTTGPTWGGVMEAQEKVAINNPTTGLVGLEVDCRANGTDANHNRICVDAVGTRFDFSGAPVQIWAGFRVQSGVDQANTSFGNGFLFQATGTTAFAAAGTIDVGFDTSNGIVNQAAFKMAAGQSVAFDALAARQLTFDGSGLKYSVSSNQKFKVRDSGGFEITNTAAENETLTITNTAANGVCLKLVGNGATTPSKTVRVQAGALDLINDAFNNVILNIDDLGNTKIAGNLTSRPPASATPANNGDMLFQLTSDTQLTIKVKGSDGVVRSANITLA